MVPVILAALGVVAGGKGVVDTVQGISKIKDANETKNLAEIRHKNNINKFENQNRATCTLMDEVGKRELEILKSFERFSDIIERIQNRPEFKGYKKENINLPEYNPEELQKAYVGAGVLLGALGGATLGISRRICSCRCNYCSSNCTWKCFNRYCNCKSFRSSCRQMQHWHF